MNRILTAVAVEEIARGESEPVPAARGAAVGEQTRPPANQGLIAADEGAAGPGDDVPAEGGAEGGDDDPGEAAGDDAEGGSSTSSTSSRR